MRYYNQTLLNQGQKHLLDFICSMQFLHSDSAVLFTFNCCSKYSGKKCKTDLQFFYCNFYIGLYMANNCKRAIFQIFWKPDCITRFLFFELDTSKFGSSYVFWSVLKWGSQISPNLTFWTQKRYFSDSRNTFFGIMVPGFYLKYTEICR